jgi:hypothetical protein
MVSEFPGGVFNSACPNHVRSYLLGAADPQGAAEQQQVLAVVHSSDMIHPTAVVGHGRSAKTQSPWVRFFQASQSRDTICRSQVLISSER